MSQLPNKVALPPWIPRSCWRGQKSTIRNGWGKFCSIVPDWERTWWYGSSNFPPKSVPSPSRHLKSFHQGGPGHYSNPNACRAQLSPENLPTNSRSSEAPAHPWQGSSGLKDLQNDGVSKPNRFFLVGLFKTTATRIAQVLILPSRLFICLPQRSRVHSSRPRNVNK